jgi:hypothetical protein
MTYSNNRLRVYFFTPSGEELSDHPLHGLNWQSSGQFVSDRKGRDEVRGMRIRNSVGVYVDGLLSKPREVTREDFGGPVIVKEWFGGTVSDVYWLA